MKKLTLFIFMLVIVNSLPLFAQEENPMAKKVSEAIVAQALEEHPIDKKLRESIDKDWTTVGMNDSMAVACEEWDVELNRYYNLLMGILSEEEKKELREAQRAWLKYRDLKTEFRMNVFYNTNGTLYSNLAMAEKKAIVKERALDLRGLYRALNHINPPYKK